MEVNPKSVVVLSGGMDSTISMFCAMTKGFEVVHAITFDYGQRHHVEIKAAQKIASIAGVDSYVIPIDVFKFMENSALVGIGDINKPHDNAENLPASFVPGRNILFLTVVAMHAYKHGIPNIITGVCQTDYSGYPDCRDHTMKYLTATLSFGMEFHFKIITPLMWLDKKDSIKMVMEFPQQIRKKCVNALSYSHTCYEGKIPPCKRCPACKLRSNGFLKAGIRDPLLQRLEKNEV